MMPAPRTALRLVVALALLLAVPLAVHAQSTGARRIAYLSNNSLAGSSRALDAFRQGLREHGWVEGQNVAIDYRWGEGRSDRLPRLADELVRLNPELIVTPGTPATTAAQRATATIPIVMVSAADPVALGLVTSLARPGGNLTGMSFDVGLEVFAKQLELLKEAVPRVRRVAILSSSGNPAQQVAVGKLKAAAPSLGLRLQDLPVRGPHDFDTAFAAMKKEHADGVLVVADSVFNLHRASLADLGARHRMPAMYGFRDFVDSGGLMSYGPNLADLYRRAATYVDRILKGTKPGDLPVEQPTKFELVINLKTAKGLGLTVPQRLLLRADLVID